MLDAAIGVFGERMASAGTFTEMLTAMKIGRQSLLATFNDKWAAVLFGGGGAMRRRNAGGAVYLGALWQQCQGH